VAKVCQAEDLGLRAPAGPEDLHRLVAAAPLVGTRLAPLQGVATGLQAVGHDHRIAVAAEAVRELRPLSAAVEAGRRTYRNLGGSD